MRKRTNKKAITEMETPPYNKKALQRFNVVMNEIRSLDGQLSSLRDVAYICSEQNMQAILTLTVLDKNKFDELNAKAEREFLIGKLTSPDTGNIIFVPNPQSHTPGFPNFQPPQSKEQKEKEAIMDRNRKNAMLSTYQVHTENYPSISLVILDKLRIALQERRDELNQEANEIYRAIFMPQEQ